MKFTPRKIAEEQLVKIEMLQQMIQEFSHMTSFLHNLRIFEGKVDAGNIHHLLIQRELSEWRNLFMFALTLSDEERDRIKAAAYERFLRDDMNVSSWMSPSGISPSFWLASDEEEFRAMARKAFGPREKGEENAL